MIEVKIQHQNGTMHLQHPELLNELEPEQLFAVVKYIVMRPDSIEERLDDRIYLMQTLLSQSLNKYVKTKWYKLLKSMVDEGVMQELFKLQDFILKEQTFNNWILKRLEFGNCVYYGPKDRFSYMQFGEFIVADMLFMQYFESKNEDILDKFISVLFRSANLAAIGEDDKREEFNTNSIPIRAAVLKGLSITNKQSVVFNYSGVRAWLCERYPYVFSTKENKEEIVLGSNEQGGWMNIRRHLAGDVLNLDKVDHVLLHDVLNDLNEKMKES